MKFSISFLWDKLVCPQDDLRRNPVTWVVLKGFVTWICNVRLFRCRSCNRSIYSVGDYKEERKKESPALQVDKPTSKKQAYTSLPPTPSMSLC